MPVQQVVQQSPPKYVQRQPVVKVQNTFWTPALVKLHEQLAVRKEHMLCAGFIPPNGTAQQKHAAVQQVLGQKRGDIIQKYDEIC